MVPRVQEYDPMANGAGCYSLAIATKKARGDDYYPRPPLDHVPVAATRGPNWLMWVAIVGCAGVWAVVLIFIAR